MHASNTTSLGTDDLLAVCCLANGEFAAVGRRGAIWLRGDDGWSQLQTGFAEDLYGVCAHGDGFVAVGGNLDIGGQSKCVTVSGGDALVQLSSVQSVLLAVHGNESDLWACGFNGDIVRRVSGEWQQVVELDHFEHLFDIDVAADRSVTVVGMNGIVHTRSPAGAWVTKRLGKEHLMGVARAPDGASRIVGANGSMHPRPLGDSTWQCVTAVGNRFFAAGTGGAVAHDGDVQKIGDETWYGAAAQGELVVLVGAGGRVAEVSLAQSNV